MPLALVTGASTGIGRATALRLAADGWTVLAGVREQGAGERLVEAAASPARAERDGRVGERDGRAGGRAGGRVSPLLLDVTDPAQVSATIERVREQAQAGAASHPDGLDALVNNAGIGVGGPLELISADDLRRQFDVNVLAQVAVTQALLPALRRAQGKIVFVSSVGGRVAMAYTAPYAASKHALEALADGLRVELLSSHVQVALIEPGSVATPIWEKARESADGVSVPPELEQVYGPALVAMRKTLARTASRWVPPERVADTIARALAATRMRARYVVGSDARAMLIAGRVLPDRVARLALGV